VSQALTRMSLDADPLQRTVSLTPKSTSAPQSVSKRKVGDITRPLSSNTGPIIGEFMFRMLMAFLLFCDICSPLTAGPSLLTLVCRSFR
jgi:hypothetical protein